jgi:hypothetical protein
MKKCILFLVLVFSMNAFAQIRFSVTEKKHRSIPQGTQYKEKFSLKETDPANNSLGLNPLLANNNRSRELFSLIQVYDSIYSWKWYAASSGWQIDSRIISMEYNASHILLSYIEQNHSGNKWYNYARFTFIPDAQGNISSSTEERWIENTWVNYSKSVYTYDYFGNNVTKLLEQTWKNNLWENTGQYSYTFDVHNNISVETSQTWVATKWVNVSQVNYTYDLSNNLILVALQEWTSGAWINSMQASYSYNSGKLVSELDEIWNNGSWDNYASYTYTYEADNITGELIKVWDNSHWADYARFTFNYDDNNNLISETQHLWTGSNWKTYSVYTCVYDENYLITTESIKYFDGYSSSAVSGNKNSYYFHLEPAGIAGLHESETSIFPNPSNGKISINAIGIISSVDVFTLHGNLVFSSGNLNQRSSCEIDLSDSPPGIYVVVVHSGKQASKKIVIKL